jgi:hypothetical protein
MHVITTPLDALHTADNVVKVTTHKTELNTKVDVLKIDIVVQRLG